MTRDLGPAFALLEAERARELLQLVVDVPSPTGGERDLAAELGTWLGQQGVAASLGPVGGAGAAHGRRAPGRVATASSSSASWTRRSPASRSATAPCWGSGPGRREFTASARASTATGCEASGPRTRRGTWLRPSWRSLALARLGELPNLQVVGRVRRPGDARPGGRGRWGGRVRHRLSISPAVRADGPARHRGEARLRRQSRRGRHGGVRGAAAGKVGYTGIRTYDPTENTVATTARMVLALEAWCAAYADGTRPRPPGRAVRSSPCAPATRPVRRSGRRSPSSSSTCGCRPAWPSRPLPAELGAEVDRVASEWVPTPIVELSGRDAGRGHQPGRPRGPRGGAARGRRCSTKRTTSGPVRAGTRTRPCCERRASRRCGWGCHGHPVLVPRRSPWARCTSRACSCSPSGWSARWSTWTERLTADAS